MLSHAEQVRIFEQERNKIDLELRSTGFEEIFLAGGLDPSLGQLVVGRLLGYSSAEANIDIGFDPLASRMETMHEVGLRREDPNGGVSYNWYLVSQAIHGESQEPPSNAIDLDYIQLVTFRTCIDRLLDAKTRGKLPFLTKSLKKIDLAGD